MQKLRRSLQFALPLVACIAGAASLRAQNIVTRPGREGLYTFELSDGEPISYFLEHSRELQLSDSQKTLLIGVRRRLRQTNSPFMRQLDSLRELVGISLEPRGRISGEDRNALQRFQLLSQTVVDSMRANNQAAQQEARALLEDRQRLMLDSLVVHERGGAPGGRGRDGRRPPP